MRIFYALTFSEETKKALSLYRDGVANISQKGHFTDSDNFHMTLEFIGEVPNGDIDMYLEVLNELRLTDMMIEASFIGRFQNGKKKDRHIVWMGIEPNSAVSKTHKQLHRCLAEQDCDVEQRKFTPHITLGRQVILHEPLESLIIEPLKIKPNGIALMESKRVGDHLVYVPVAERLLG